MKSSRNHFLAGLGLTVACLAPQATEATEAFYNPPANLSAYQPGDLIRSEVESNLSTRVFHDVVGQRVLYRSIGAVEPVVAETAMVFVPAGTPPSGGWPVIAWGHGTTGIGDACAPSKWPTLAPDGWGAYGDFVYTLVQNGYAVVAPDYEGLGTPGLHTYVNADSEARSLLYGVVAARQLSANLSDHFATVGHSQGASASLAAGELGVPPGQSLVNVGAVGLAPVSNIAVLAEAVALMSDKFNIPYFPWLALAVKATHPSFNVNNLIGPYFTPYMADAESECFDEWFHTFRGTNNIPADQLRNPNWLGDPDVQDFLSRIETGYRQAQVPALVVWGSGDDLAIFNPDLVQRMCQNGSTVQVVTYNGIGHDGTVQHGTNDVLAWLAARFAGTAAPSLCTP